MTRVELSWSKAPSRRLPSPRLLGIVISIRVPGAALGTMWATVMLLVGGSRLSAGLGVGCPTH